MSEAAMNTEPVEAPRVVLVGESNPYGADPHYALYPLPANASGGRLARILGFPSPRQYLRAFPHRVNLLVGNKWSAPATRAAADELLASLPVGSGLVLLGTKVSAAFGADYKMNVFEPRFTQVGAAVLRGFWVVVLPHPSGLNRIWTSDPLAVTRARDAARSLCEKVRGEKGEGARSDEAKV